MSIERDKSIFVCCGNGKVVTHFLFHATGQAKYRTLLLAVWVTEGVDRCVVGYLPEKYHRHADELNGRLFQVVELFSKATAPNKKRYCECYKGVCIAALVEDVGGIDTLISDVVSCNESDSSDE